MAAADASSRQILCPPSIAPCSFVWRDEMRQDHREGASGHRSAHSDACHEIALIYFRCLWHLPELADLQRADELGDDGYADHEVDEVGSVHGHSDEDEKCVPKEAQATLAGKSAKTKS